MAIDRSWFVQFQGRDFVLFGGLLDAATKQGLKSVVTTPIQMPSADNGGTAVMSARVEFEDGRVFEAIGDASKESCGRMIHPHIIRMAETRAVGRAFRWALNISATMREELGDEEAAAVGANGSARRAAVVPDQPAEPAPLSAGANIAIKHGPVCEICQEPLKPSTYRAAMSHFGRGLCETHGRAERDRLRAEAETAAAS